jgi:hypothetical protein
MSLALAAERWPRILEWLHGKGARNRAPIKARMDGDAWE